MKCCLGECPILDGNGKSAHGPVRAWSYRRLQDTSDRPNGELFITSFLRDVGETHSDCRPSGGIVDPISNAAVYTRETRGVALQECGALEDRQCAWVSTVNIENLKRYC